MKYDNKLIPYDISEDIFEEVEKILNRIEDKILDCEMFTPKSDQRIARIAKRASNKYQKYLNDFDPPGERAEHEKQVFKEICKASTHDEIILDLYHNNFKHKDEPYSFYMAKLDAFLHLKNLKPITESESLPDDFGFILDYIEENQITSFDTLIDFVYNTKDDDLRETLIAFRHQFAKYLAYLDNLSYGGDFYAKCNYFD